MTPPVQSVFLQTLLYFVGLMLVQYVGFILMDHVKQKEAQKEDTLYAAIVGYFGGLASLLPPGVCALMIFMSVWEVFEAVAVHDAWRLASAVLWGLMGGAMMCASVYAAGVYQKKIEEREQIRQGELLRTRGGNSV